MVLAALVATRDVGPEVVSKPAALVALGSELKPRALEGKLEQGGLVVAQGWWSPARWWPGAVPVGTRGQGVLELVDGSVIMGRCVGGVGEESIVWNNDQLGKLTFKLDQVSSMTVSGARAERRSVKADTVRLSNGDALEGLVLSVSEQGSEQGGAITIERNKERSTIPLDRVREVRLANPARAPKGARVWLDDGTELACATVARQTSGAWSVELEGRTIELSAARVRGATAEVSKYVGLGQMTLIDQEPGEGRRWWSPVEMRSNPSDMLGASDVVLAGPMRVRWKLPEGAKRLGGWVVLPEEARSWGECELIVRIDGRELSRLAMSAGKPEAELGVDVPSGAKELSVELKQGPRGAVQNTLVLRKWIVVKQ